ncbi:MAG: site-2 protease family protein [Opitutaceae bacterium]|nr:site-2 protease family protein [Opitutaceae bacterium]
MFNEIGLPELREALIYLIIIVASLALHEWGHAYMADRLGDPTPRSEGRVTLNPLVHIDLFGTIIIPLLGALGFFGGFSMIGWAKPVWTNPSYFRRGNFDRALVTLAGPGMNFGLALVSIVLAAISVRFLPSLTPLFHLMMEVNVGLMIFNLLPIPPLDGSKFLMYWFGMSEETYLQVSKWGPLALILVINLQSGREVFGKIYHAAYYPFGLLYGALT